MKKCCTPVAQPEIVTIQNDNEDDNQGFIVPNTVEIPTERVVLASTEDSEGVSDSDERYQQSTESDQDSAAKLNQYKHQPK